MISQIVDPPERLREEAQALAETIARNSPAAMAATKKALWGALEMGLTDACRAKRAASRVDVGPPRPGRRATRVRREARPAVAGARSRRRGRVNLVALLEQPPEGATGDDPVIYAGDLVVTRDELTARSTRSAAR